jgi:hypothetical protein
MIQTQLRLLKEFLGQSHLCEHGESPADVWYLWTVLHFLSHAA